MVKQWFYWKCIAGGVTMILLQPFGSGFSHRPPVRETMIANHCAFSTNSYVVNSSAYDPDQISSPIRGHDHGQQNHGSVGRKWDGRGQHFYTNLFPILIRSTSTSPNIFFNFQDFLFFEILLVPPLTMASLAIVANIIELYWQ